MSLARTYDVAENGRFLMVQTTEMAQSRPEIVFVLNWFEDLKQRVPVK